ncbi:hypothetical protein D9M69_470660 [compost metagenome]
MLRKPVRDLVPGRLGAHEDMLARPQAGVPVQRAHHHFSDPAGMGADQRRPALLAETPPVPRRGLVAVDKLLARDPVELVRVNNAPSHERRPVRLAAHRTVAVA